MPSALDRAFKLHSGGRLDEAEAVYRQILDTAPDHADVLQHLGLIAHQRGNHAEAAELVEHAIRLDPKRPHFFANLGAVRMSQSRAEDAVECFRQAIRLDPTLVSAFYALGNLLWERGENEQAAECYASVVRLDPDHDSARHLHAATAGQPRDRAPAGYVREIFDGFSDRFEARLVGSLGYRVPEVLRQAVGRARRATEADWNVLDLGCGTGLCGVLFRDNATHLAGVDLSSKMIDQARAKRVYDELRAGDLMEELRARRRRWDLILAADVFIYVGALREVMSACRSGLAQEGLLAFSIENSDREPFQLAPSGRFVHSRRYIEDLAEEQGFSIVRRDTIGLRLERGVAVPGTVYVLCAGEAPLQTDLLDADLAQCESTLSVLKKAIEFHREERLPEASTLYRRVLAREPENEKARRLLSMIESAPS